ncbi:MAG TPA: hypothetical protein PKE26_13505 [Kiritimatiellia bacterium]|nr:hypothetical protein [Kiritimatiellia bacterium]HMP00117.1 hypothetical protein [Kiritimatiellia bacterium]HMP96578.1 hypothetical protein [Kiritimatiellia bacterium]
MTKGQTRRGKKNNFILPVALLVGLFLIGQAYWLSSNRHMFAPFAISRISCDTCAKVGLVRDAADSRITRMCPACFGVGYHTVRRFDEQDVICVPCGGMGRLEEDGAWRTCQRCSGRGLHRRDEWKTLIEVEAASAPANDEHSESRTLNPEP